jgi:hypothetical protein
MGLFKKKSDPISERERALNAEIAALESQIKKLSEQSSSGAIPVEPSVASSSPEVPQEMVFEKVEQRPLQAEAAAVTQDHYNEMGGRKFDVPALLNRWRGIVQGKPSTNPKLVNYLAAGSVQGLRPLRYEKRIARNRFLLLAGCLVILIWGILAWVVHNR